MASDYIPKSDSDFTNWFTNFVQVSEANLAILGITQEEIKALKAESIEFDSLLKETDNLHAQAKSVTERKNTCRKDSELLTRSVVKRIQAKGNVSNDLKKLLQIRVPGETPAPPIVPYPPINLVANVISSNLIELKWERNNNSKTILFCVEAKIDEEKQWKQVISVTKTSYKFPKEMPMKSIVFRVRAQHINIMSAPSNETLINF